MARWVVASLMGVAGAAALVLSAFQPWYQGRTARDVPALDLFTGLEGPPGSIAASMFLPLAVAAGIAVLALLVRSKVLMTLAGVAGLTTCVLWVVQQGRDVAPVAFGFTDLERGLWNAAGGVLLVLLTVAVLPSRGR
ncbi:hypothetical protein [Streptomyces sp. NPDC059452]|uniref:hypothetical protein n=1 Tax=Streptomyces sp. NPDC059452 TaxID=3346835 RepID=UPI0036AC4014